MKLLRTIRFDGTDERIFELAAGPDEWAVPGGFAFADSDPKEITGKTRQAFTNGFLGVTSFGRSTFVSVAEADGDDLNLMEQQLAGHFVSHYGAPDMAAALAAAKVEAAFARELASDAPLNTVLTIRRVMDDDGSVREEFRTITPPSGAPQHTRIWTVVDDDA